MKKIIHLIAFMLFFIIISCKDNPEEPYQPPSFDDLFYQNYKGVDGTIVNIPKYENFCCNEKSFFEIKNDGTINLRICGIRTNGSMDFQTAGEVEILNKTFVSQRGLDVAYWSFNTKIKIGNNFGSNYQYLNCKLYPPSYLDNETSLLFGDLRIFINDKTYFSLMELWKNYKKGSGC